MLISEPKERRLIQRLLRKHHYLGGLKAVGEQMHYAAVDGRGRWLAVLLFSAAAKHLKHRDQWIGWTRAQRDRRLSLVVNNSRFLILPESWRSQPGFTGAAPDLGSAQRRLAGSLWPSGAGGRNLRRSGAVLRHRLHRQRLAGVGLDRRLGPLPTRLLCCSTTSPSGCLSANWSQMPAAACKPNISSQLWPRWRRRPGRAVITNVRRSGP